MPDTLDVATYGAVTGKLRESSENRLVSVVLNEPIPDSEFRIRFPPGTQVTRIHTPYDTQEYVVRGDGELVPASPRRRVNVPPAQERSWSSWGLIGAGVLLLPLAIAWGAWRRRRHA